MVISHTQNIQITGLSVLIEFAENSLKEHQTNNVEPQQNLQVYLEFQIIIIKLNYCYFWQKGNMYL